VNGNSTRRVVVESGGTGVVAHVGLHALGHFGDRLGLGNALSSRIPWEGRGFPLHDRGKVLVQSALMLAGGGESCLDIEHLRIGDDLFGSVRSDTTVARTFHEITPSSREGIATAMAEMRAEVWSRSSTTTGTEPVLLDIDASLVEIHSENKEQTAATFKGGFGFHPLFCFADATMHKSRSEYRDGYKAHIVIEPETGLVTACALTPANAPDGKTGVELLARDEPGLQVLADGAYGSGDTLAALHAADHVTAIKPFPTTTAVPGGFHRDDFTVDRAARTVTCPAGHAVPIRPKRRSKLRTSLPRLSAPPALH